MRVITLAGSPRFPSRSSSLLEYAREKLNGLDVEVYHWNLQNFAPEDLLNIRLSWKKMSGSGKRLLPPALVLA